MTDDDDMYMLRDEPKDVPRKERFGGKRLNIGYEGKHIKSVMIPDINGEYRSEAVYLKSYGQPDEGDDTK